MKKIENTALQMIAEASRCPDYGPDMVKSLMKKLDMNEKPSVLGKLSVAKTQEKTPTTPGTAMKKKEDIQL